MKVSKIHEITEHEAPIYTIEKGIKKETILTAGGDRVVPSWSLKSFKQDVFQVQTEVAIYSLLNIDDDRLIIGLANGRIYCIDTKLNNLIQSIKLSDKPIYNLAFNSNYIFSLSGDGYVSIFKPSNFELLRRIPITNTKLRGIDISKEFIAIGRGDGVISILETELFNEKYTLKGHSDSVNTLLFNNGYLISGGKDGHLLVWDVEDDFRLQNKIPAHNFAIYKLVASPNNKYIASASRDKSIKIWNSQTMDFICKIDFEKYKGHKASVNNLLWNKQGLISVSDDKKIIIWNIQE